MKTATKSRKVTKGRAKAKVTKKVARHRPLLDADELVAKEKEYVAEGYKIVKGTLCNRGEDPKKDPKFKNKRSVVITCGKRGCDEQRRIATSDLHQVKFCLPHTLEDRAERKNENRRKGKKPTKKRSPK